MLVLDGLRHLRNRKLYVPQFHLGHLGFIPGITINCLKETLDDRHGQELTLTPFQGHRDELFLIKCVFKDAPGVVLQALSAFATLGLNILSLESATIESATNRKKHILFCILSWNTSKFKRPVPIDEGTRQKFLNVLTLLPIQDWRYLLLLEILILFCGDTLDTDEMPSVGGVGLQLPKIYGCPLSMVPPARLASQSE